MTRRSYKKLEAEGVGTSDDGLDVRARILDRTIYLMGKQGTTDVTVRAIAHEAGVNVAAVNYYFSSKERMISLMAERFRIGFEAVMALLADEDVELEQRLRSWAASVVGFLSEYPGILTLMERQLATQPLDAFGETLRSAMQSAIQQLEAFRSNSPCSFRPWPVLTPVNSINDPMNEATGPPPSRPNSSIS